MDESVSLEELLQRETAWVEWKETGDRLAVVKTLVAFANDESDSGRGGHVLCGIDETKDAQGSVRPNIVGLTQGERTGLKQKVLESCANDVSPPLSVTVREEPVAGDSSRAVVIFFAAVSSHVHEHQTEKGSKVWGRRDSSTREIKREALRQLRLRKGEIPHILDRLAYVRSLQQYASMSHIYRMAFDQFHQDVELRRPADDYFKPDERIDALSPPLCTLLETAPGHKHIVPTNLAILLFGHAPTHFLPGAYAIVSEYPGTARTTEASARRKFTGPLIKIIRDVIDKLNGLMGVFMDKSRSASEIRQNRRMYSETAVQEVVMNAFAHRDYENHEPVRITVFSDRIEVVSPGGLPKPQDAERIRAGLAVGPHWRNPGLSSFLERLKLGVQAEGQGIPTIFEKTKETAERPPEYEIDQTEVRVIIPAYHPVPTSFHGPPAPPSPEPTGRDVLIMVSIGSRSIRTLVDLSRKRLGLEHTDVAMDFSLEGYVDPAQDGFGQFSKKMRDEMATIAEDPTVARMHLFYRGPVVFAPLFGALAVNRKSLVIYYYDEKGEYQEAYTINTKFLKSRD